MSHTLNDSTVVTIINFLQENWGALIAILISVWMSFMLLQVLFVAIVKTIGWIGYYLVAAIPGTITYFVTHYAFGQGTDQASMQAIATALLIGVVSNILGISNK